MDWNQLDPAWILMNVVVLLLSLSVHESAHAWTADHLGDHTARSLGRVTLNPIPHVDVVGTILFPLMGLLSGWALFGWAKPVPVNTLNLANPRKDHLLIASAGPASNVVLAILSLIGLRSLSGFGVLPAGEAPVLTPLLLFLHTGLILNVILAVFNLIPVPPLDGSWILSGILPAPFSQLMEGIRPYGFLLLILLLWSGFFEVVLIPVVVFVRGLAV